MSAGIRNKKYCFKNKQYSKEEYEKILKSYKLDTFSGAEKAQKRGYKWQDNIQRTTGKETLKPKDIPDSINDVGDIILDEVLSCINCNRNYKIVPNELIFYKKMSIPIPRKCFHCRHADRLKKRNPFKLKCTKNLSTSQVDKFLD